MWKRNYLIHPLILASTSIANNLLNDCNNNYFSLGSLVRLVHVAQCRRRNALERRVFRRRLVNNRCPVADPGTPSTGQKRLVWVGNIITQQRNCGCHPANPLQKGQPTSIRTACPPGRYGSRKGLPQTQMCIFGNGEITERIVLRCLSGSRVCVLAGWLKA